MPQIVHVPQTSPSPKPQDVAQDVDTEMFPMADTLGFATVRWLEEIYQIFAKWWFDVGLMITLNKHKYNRNT